MKILVVGGTGFIGYHIVRKLLQEGMDVCILSRNNTGIHHHGYKASLAFIKYDVYNSSIDEVRQFLRGMDGVVYATGVDERVTSEGCAYDFFSNKNIKPMKCFIEAALLEEINSFILLNSIFSYFERTRPALQLYKKHDYIRSRVDQRNIAMKMASDKMQMVVLEIPYVFGAVPYQVSQWRNMVNYASLATPILLTNGGANMMSVKTLANAVHSAIHGKVKSGCYPVGDKNVSWSEFIAALRVHQGLPEKSPVILPDKVFDGLSRAKGVLKNLLRLSSGLDSRYMADIVTRELYLDINESRNIIGYDTDSLDQAFYDTVKNCSRKRYMPDWLSL